jgi:hypothetical protein
MSEVKAAAATKKPTKVKLVAKNQPFSIIPTGQVIPPEGALVEVDGWVQANIDNGLLIVCS